MQLQSANHILCVVPVVIVSLSGVMAETYHRGDGNCWTGTVLVWGIVLHCSSIGRVILRKILGFAELRTNKIFLL